MYVWLLRQFACFLIVNNLTEMKYHFAGLSYKLSLFQINLEQKSSLKILLFAYQSYSSIN